MRTPAEAGILETVWEAVNSSIRQNSNFLNWRMNMMQDPTTNLLEHRRDTILARLASDNVPMAQALSAFDELAEIETALGLDHNPEGAEADRLAETAFARYGY
jgi:hypothetical protein